MNHVQHVDWALIAPVLAPALAAVLVLVLDAVLPRGLLSRRGPVLLDLVAGAGLLAGIVALLPLAGERRATFCVGSGLNSRWAIPVPGAGVAQCSYAAEPVTTGLQLVILLAAGVCLLLAIGQRVQPPRAEHHLLLLAATAGAVAVAGARDLATVLVALETASLPVVGLVGLRRDARGAEAALKLLLTSVVSVALLVLGIAMIYAACGTLHLGALGSGTLVAGHRCGARAWPASACWSRWPGIAFKLSVVPFQLWTPDTYAGAPLPVAAFLSAVSKAAGLAALVVVLVAGRRRRRRDLVPGGRRARSRDDDRRQPGRPPAARRRPAAGLEHGGPGRLGDPASGRGRPDPRVRRPGRGRVDRLPRGVHRGLAPRLLGRRDRGA